MNNPFKALGDLNKLRQQAKKMQDELSAEIIRIEEGDIVVEISGSQEVKKVYVQGVTSQELIDVLNKAIKKSQELAAQKLQQMTGGLGGMLGGGGPQ
ncbi:YbaB/EbfC family nucleoid-associated protein [Candidatus Woesebacteria bacterium]|nr:YbaB/EbfC family nucleoid-associated protein [Candidatus Woesebacteria bacterium]